MHVDENKALKQTHPLYTRVGSEAVNGFIFTNKVMHLERAMIIQLALLPEVFDAGVIPVILIGGTDNFCVGIAEFKLVFFFIERPKNVIALITQWMSLWNSAQFLEKFNDSVQKRQRDHHIFTHVHTP